MTMLAIVWVNNMVASVPAVRFYGTQRRLVKFWWWESMVHKDARSILTVIFYGTQGRPVNSDSDILWYTRTPDQLLTAAAHGLFLAVYILRHIEGRIWRLTHLLHLQVSGNGEGKDWLMLEHIMKGILWHNHTVWPCSNTPVFVIYFH